MPKRIATDTGVAIGTPAAEAWAPLSAERLAEWDAARDELAARFGWAPGPRVKQFLTVRGAELEQWLLPEKRKPGEGVYQGIVFGPERLADTHPDTQEATIVLWRELDALAEEESARAGASIAASRAQGEKDFAAEVAKRGEAWAVDQLRGTRKTRDMLEGLGFLAPNPEESAVKAEAALARASAAGVPAAHIFRLCATSLCQTAEWAFWRSGMRVKSGGDAFYPIHNLFYDKNPDALWATVFACWDARALGYAPGGPELYEFEKTSVVSSFLGGIAPPWTNVYGDARQGTPEERRAKMDGIWDSRWMKMAIEASLAGEPPLRLFAVSAWKTMVYRIYNRDFKSWQYAVDHGLPPGLLDDEGQNAMHWIFEPTAETGSEGEYTLASPEAVNELMRLGPDVYWLAPDRKGHGPFYAGDRRLQAPDRRAEHDQAKAVALLWGEKRVLDKIVHEGAATDNHKPAARL